MKTKKKDPKKIAAELAAALHWLGRATKRHRRTSAGMRRAVEKALKMLGAHGITGQSAAQLVAAVVGTDTKPCTRCGATDGPMSGRLCIDCAVLEQRAAVSRSFS